MGVRGSPEGRHADLHRDQARLPFPSAHEAGTTPSARAPPEVRTAVKWLERVDAFRTADCYYHVSRLNFISGLRVITGG